VVFGRGGADAVVITKYDRLSRFLQDILNIDE